MWQPLLIITKMAPEIANIGLHDDAGLESFLAKWGLPIVEVETKPASMRLDDVWELVHRLRIAIAHADTGADRSFADHFRHYAFLAARPAYGYEGAHGEAPLYVECRDPASFAWMQLARRGEASTGNAAMWYAFHGR